MSKITINRVKEIIREELTLLEGDDHDGIKKVVNSSIDLLKAVESFESKATAQQKSAVNELLEQLKSQLTTMRDGAGSYVDVPLKGPKKVVLKKSPDTDTGLSD